MVAAGDQLKDWMGDGNSAGTGQLLWYLIAHPSFTLADLQTIDGLGVIRYEARDLDPALTEAAHSGVYIVAANSPTFETDAARHVKVKGVLPYFLPNNIEFDPLTEDQEPAVEGGLGPDEDEGAVEMPHLWSFPNPFYDAPTGPDFNLNGHQWWDTAVDGAGARAQGVDGTGASIGILDSGLPCLWQYKTPTIEGRAFDQYGENEWYRFTPLNPSAGESMDFKVDGALAVTLSFPSTIELRSTGSLVAPDPAVIISGDYISIDCGTVTDPLGTDSPRQRITEFYMDKTGSYVPPGGYQFNDRTIVGRARVNLVGVTTAAGAAAALRASIASQFHFRFYPMASGAGGSTVTLANQHRGEVAEVPLFETITGSGSWTPNGMARPAAADALSTAKNPMQWYADQIDAVLQPEGGYCTHLSGNRLLVATKAVGGSIEILNVISADLRAFLNLDRKMGLEVRAATTKTPVGDDSFTPRTQTFRYKYMEQLFPHPAFGAGKFATETDTGEITDPTKGFCTLNFLSDFLGDLIGSPSSLLRGLIGDHDSAAGKEGRYTGPSIRDYGATSAPADRILTMDASLPSLFGLPAGPHAHSAIQGFIGIQAGDSLVVEDGTGDDGTYLIEELIYPTYGSYSPVGGSKMPDTSLVTLDDGVNTPTTFEWDKGGDGVAGVNVAIPYVGNENSVAMAILFMAAVNGVGGTLLISAPYREANRRVVLEQDAQGLAQITQVILSGPLHSNIQSTDFKASEDNFIHKLKVDSNWPVGGLTGLKFKVVMTDKRRALYDHAGHGTWVAGMIGADHTASGFHGLAQGAEMTTGRAGWGGTFGALLNTAQGIDRLNFASNVNIMNLSFGATTSNETRRGSGRFMSQDVQGNAIQAAHRNDILVVGATGNDGRDLDTEPLPGIKESIAENPLVMGAGATGPLNAVRAGGWDPTNPTDPAVNLDSWARYSNYGVGAVSVVAPGGSQSNGTLFITTGEGANSPNNTYLTNKIWGISPYRSYVVSANVADAKGWLTQGHAPITGTSFSAPLVCACAALIYEAKGVNPKGRAVLRALLESTADDLVGEANFDPIGRDPRFGSGRINANDAVAGA